MILPDISEGEKKKALTNYNRTSSSGDVRGYQFVKVVHEMSLVT